MKRRGQRLDAAMTARGLAPSRTRAASLIQEGRVQVDAQLVAKPSKHVQPDSSILVQEAEVDRWVGRAAGKLDAALTALVEQGHPLNLDGAVCLDAGASTGGFTQVLLEQGASRVHAVDVGHGQLHTDLDSDARVQNQEGVNLRHVEAGFIHGGVDVVVGDLSFISLTLVLGPIMAQLKAGGQALMLIKPQFEVGRNGLGKSGVVTQPALRKQAVGTVVEHAASLDIGLTPRALIRSEVPGHDGNIEFFILWEKALENTVNISSPSEAQMTALLDAVDYC